MAGMKVFSNGIWDDPVPVAGGDNGLLRSIEGQTVHRMRFFNPTSGVWAGSEVLLFRTGPVVHMHGTFRRSSTTGTSWERNIAYVLGPFFPHPSYETTFLVEGGVVLPASGMTSSSTSVSAEVQIDRSGMVSIKTSAAVTQIAVRASYLAKDSAILQNPLDSPDYRNSELKAFLDKGGMVEGEHFATFVKRGEDPRFASVCIHGGAGEPGAQEAAIALSNLMGSSLYYFDMMNGNYPTLHMDSNGFDDPRAVSIIRDAQRTVVFHGESLQPDLGNMSYVGGLDDDLRFAIMAKLSSNGFPCIDAVAQPELGYGGNSKRNIANLGPNSGVQIECSSRLRSNFFVSGSTAREGRGNLSQVLYDYVGLIEEAVTPFLT